MESKYRRERPDIDRRNELFCACIPDLLRIREAGEQDWKQEMQSKPGAGVYFWFPQRWPFEATGKDSLKKIHVVFSKSTGPFTDLINITGEYLPPLPMKQVQYIGSKHQTDGLSWLRLLQCGSERCWSSIWCSQAGENRKLPHSGRAMMDAHCRATSTWPPYKLSRG